MNYEQYVIPVILALIGAVSTFAVYKKAFKQNGNLKMIIGVLGAIALVVGAGGVYSIYSGSDLPILGSAFLTTVGGDSGQTETNTPVETESKSRVLDTLKAISRTKYSNSYSTVAGTLSFYDKDTTPGEPNANAIDTITLSSGVGSTTNGYLKTNTQYRASFDGDGTYYDVDYGLITISEDDFNPSTGTAQFDLGDILTVATISDMINESGVGGDVNGQSDATVGTAELGSNTTDYFWYDESVGDQQFYIQPTFESTTANTGLKNPVVCFDFDRSNPPEGTEITAISTQVVDGTGFGIPSDLTDYWVNQQCVSLGSEMKAGTSSKVKLTFTVSESNLDNMADVWYLEMDDLGDYLGQDINRDTGATADSITFNSQA